MMLSTREAARLGRVGGIVSAGPRKGNREWGRIAQRQRAARAQKEHYPELSREWARNATRARLRQPLKVLPLVMTPGAIHKREVRELERRRAAYEHEQQRKKGGQ